MFQRRNKGTLKALFIHNSPDKPLYVEDVQAIAKAEALRIGLAKKKELLRIPYLNYVPHLNGWVVVVQNLW